MEEFARLQREMNERVNREVELGLREARAREGEGVVTPRRSGPPTPAEPASIAGEYMHWYRGCGTRQREVWLRHTRSTRRPSARLRLL